MGTEKADEWGLHPLHPEVVVEGVVSALMPQAVVCECQTRDRAEQVVREHNAHAELLAACEELLDLADCDPTEIGGVEKLIKDRARAAVAKAKGATDGER